MDMFLVYVLRGMGYMIILPLSSKKKGGERLTRRSFAVA